MSALNAEASSGETTTDVMQGATKRMWFELKLSVPDILARSSQVNVSGTVRQWRGRDATDYKCH